MVGGRRRSEGVCEDERCAARCFHCNSFGNAMSRRDWPEHVVTILTAPEYESGTVYGVRSEAGIVPLDS